MSVSGFFGKAGLFFVKAARFVWTRFLCPVGTFFKRLWKHRKGRFGLIVVAALVFFALFAPLLTPYDPKTPSINEGYLPPSWTHLLGTDGNGVDILAQILYGTRVSLIIGLTSGLCVTLVGAFLGIVAGYYSKWAGGAIMRVVDVLLVIPTLPLMVILHKYVSSSYVMMIFIFIAFGWPGTARIIRAQVLSLKNGNYIKAAELFGAKRNYITRRHILPAVSHLLIMNCALASAGFMIAEAGLSFIGLGDPSAVSWGQLLVKAEGGAFTSRLWAWVLAPGAAIFFAVIGFMQIGYALEELLNPKIGGTGMTARAWGEATDAQIEEAEEQMREPSPEEAAAIREQVRSER
ncbi:ABC transporter permease [Clostridia bacterium]|nr:ABC transporter permease [Clostridia bacterium]